ncbi:MAG TPA: hypothetical protein VFF47_00165 [Nitrospirota bacterium]|nr:hypothetical protein [Nitrospirota bacterium]
MKEKELKLLLKNIQDERFVHHVSELTYERLFALWHLSPSIGRQMSRLISKVVIGLFFIRYLSHINDLVASDAGIKERPKSFDLSDSKAIEKIIKKLEKSSKFRSILESDILPDLIDIIDHTKALDLNDLIILSHSGDYLATALDDMKESDDPEYQLWLESIPDYYQKDVMHLGLKKRSLNSKGRKINPLILDKWVANLNQHSPSINAVFKNGKTISLKPWIAERRRPLLGFIRRTVEA